MEEHVTHITDCLRVYECNLGLRRFGKTNDGGYVMVWPIPFDAFLSGGICGDNSFERDVLSDRPHLTCDAYDPTGLDGAQHERYRFHAEGVPVSPTWNARNMLVKLDIEGDEWDWLNAAKLENVAQLVVELHSPHLGRWSWPTLAHLAETHALIHAHGNNWDGIVDIEGVRIPGTLETTWVRRDLAGELRPNTRRLPTSLDMPNVAGRADHVIDWAPFVWGPA